MASSDSGEKSEEPTAKKLSDARKKGQIARSKDLGTFFVLVGSACAILLVGNSLASSMSKMMAHMFSLSRAEAMDVNALFKVINDGIYQIIPSLLWIFFYCDVSRFHWQYTIGWYEFFN
jgi:flagellar biosynthetic protein FlhB